MVLFVTAMFAHICFGMNQTWVLTDKSVISSDPSLLKFPVMGLGVLLSPYHETNVGESYIKQLQFVYELEDKQQTINLGAFKQYENLLEQFSFRDNYYYLIEKGNEKAFIQVKGIAENYYEKWGSFARSDVYEEGDKIDFRIVDKEKNAIFQSVYDQASIKQIREYLRNGKRFAIKWLNAGENMPDIVVTSIEQNCNIYWDGWKPELGGGSDRLGELDFEKPYEITIDLEKNKIAEAQYIQNKRISKGFLLGLASLIIWKFWDHLVALKDAIKSDYSRPSRPYVIHSGNPSEVVVK